MSEEEEFGHISDDTEGLVHCDQAIVQDHPDFRLYDEEQVHNATLQPGNALNNVLKQLPEQKDLHRWKVMTVQLRPDRSWPILRDLITTVCMARGLLVSSEDSHSVTYTRRMVITPFSHANVMAQGQSRVANAEDNGGKRETQNGTIMILYVHIGVSASKLRVLTLCTTFYNENKFLNTLSGPLKNGEAITRELYQILVDLQSLLIKQYLPLTNLFMKTPENTIANQIDDIALDEGYTADVRRMYQSEMKQNLRELCIPLEEYAYDQEYACALLLGLLDPLIKKHSIDLQAAQEITQTTPEKLMEQSLTNQKPDADTHVLEQQPTNSNNPIYGQIINRKVHELWNHCEQECNAKLKEKIREKKNQISAKANSARRLRRYAIESIVQSEQVEVTTLRPCRIGDRLDVLLYECTCMVNSIPSKLHVTYGGLIYQTLIPFFSKTVDVPITNVKEVVKSQTLGIRMISLHECGSERKTTTIAKGIEIDLLYELLVEIHSIHTEKSRNTSVEPAQTTREEL
ncbi:unnamed protein product [Albugo candida]|uniref:Uncharacterized protein n=1 Tax=Albugo candida TaxID=65357 RepID=A0A024GEC3_9STRA|nr:unnamed protein product [Albugo candida]|eukprot:CCI45024.1 unnamed protein product [Albugo candida]